MGLTKKIVPFNFTTGINTSGDEFLKEGNDKSENIVFDDKGTLKKAKGSELGWFA